MDKIAILKRIKIWKDAPEFFSNQFVKEEIESFLNDLWEDYAQGFSKADTQAILKGIYKG